MGEWITVRISDIAESMGDAPFGTAIKNCDYTNSGALIIQGKNIQGRACDWSDRRFVSQEKYASLPRSQCSPGDLVFPKVGTIGKVGILTPFGNQKEYLLSTNTMRLRVNEKIACKNYVYYFFTSPKIINLIHAINSKSVQPVFNFTTLKSFEITLPPLGEQKEIGRILSTLDDKIEVNWQMNETLEAMARAVFKSWFVDFDPVRAKMEGRQPVGMDAVTAALFPDSFEESSLGLIPKGWRITPLSEFAEIVMGQSPPGDTYNEMNDGLPFFQGTRDFGFRFPKRRVYCSKPTRLAKAGDVLLSVRAPVGELNKANEDCAIGRGVAALRLPQKPDGFLYYLLHAYHLGWKKFEAGGTVFGSASKTDISTFKVVLPPRFDLVSRFSEFVQPIDSRILCNTEESAALVAARETLLPKLLSGEIRVKDAEKYEAVIR